MRKKANATNRAHRICCVAGCRNSEHRNPELHFYTFPGRQWEERRKNNWIAAARLTSNGKNGWSPRPHTRICSAHFAGGEKTNDPRKESYNPTIFPWNNAHEHAQRRSTELKNENVLGTECSSSVILPHAPPDAVPQTDSPKTTSAENTSNSLFCSENSALDKTSTLTMVASSLCRQKPIKEEIFFVSPEILKSARESCLSSDNGTNFGFSGFNDGKDDKTMNQLCGVSQSFFNILSKIIPEDNKMLKNLCRENRLLIFLMKMKLGLSFATLGCLFNVSEETASKIFFDLLKMLFSQTKTWIFWPSKEAINKTMPATFTDYPKCRAIINCTEFRCEDPPELEKRVSMYSPCIGQYTVKYLIATSPSGLITFLSKGYAGRTTNEYIAADSGVIHLLEPDDEILADKDYPQLQEELLKRQCTLITPPYLLASQLIRKEVSERYASVRKIAENVIQGIKVYKILENIDSELLSYIDEIMFIVCVLANNK